MRDRKCETSLAAKEFRAVYDEAGSTSLVDLVIDGGQPLNVLVHEVDVDPITSHPIHVDLLEVDMKKKITAEVPLMFVNDAPAVKELDGTLLINQDTVEVECLPKDLPKEIEVDLSSLKTFDDAITAAMITLPAGVELITDTEVDLVFVQPPREEEVEEEVVSAEEAEKAVIEGMAAEDAAKLAEKEADGEKKED